MLNIGERLRCLRINMGMTQDEVAEKLSLTRQAISGYETGKRQPDIDMIIKMAEIYNTDLQGVIYGNEAVVKHFEKTKIWARSLLIIVVILTMIGAGLQWTASCFFPLENGSVEQAVIQVHSFIISAGESVDRLTFILAFLGELGLAIYAADYAGHISFKEKGVYTLALVLLPLIICGLFGLSRKSLSLMNYLINPFFLAVLAGIMLLINVLICMRKSRKD